MKNLIEAKLAELQAEHLEVINESHQHNVPANSQTHFKLICVASAFEGLRAVQRHQRVYALLDECFKGGLHALALHLYTPQEWQLANVPSSPLCLGGSKEA